MDSDTDATLPNVPMLDVDDENEARRCFRNNDKQVTYVINFSPLNALMIVMDRVINGYDQFLKINNYKLIRATT